jgi:hypothetical protein
MQLSRDNVFNAMNIVNCQNQAIEIVNIHAKTKKKKYFHINIFLWFASSEKSVESYKTGKS